MVVTSSQAYPSQILVVWVAVEKDVETVYVTTSVVTIVFLQFEIPEDVQLEMVDTSVIVLVESRTPEAVVEGGDTADVTMLHFKLISEIPPIGDKIVPVVIVPLTVSVIVATISEV